MFNRKDEFECLLREAYIHPCERRFADNPDVISNDSYSFIKRYKHSEEKVTYYEDIIRKDDKDIAADPNTIQEILIDEIIN